MSEGEPPYVSEARRRFSKLALSFDELAKNATRLHASDQEATGRISDLQRRLSETEQRALQAERQAEQLKEKAERGERLDEAVTKLNGALDDLPLTIEQAHTIPSAVRPGVDLYGTYEWQAVINAKFHVMEQLKERRKL